MQIPQTYPTLDYVDVIIILELMLNHHAAVIFGF
jgi:hypothetical protein